MKLEDLKPAPGSTHRRKRVGRGIGSGHGRTATRGTKGQKARGQVRPGFEGGQTPFHRRLPHRRGFTNIFKKEFAIVNLPQLEVFEENTEITPELLLERKIIKDLKGGLKVLGDGEISKALIVKANAFSKSAAAKIESAGGRAEVI